MIRRSSGKKGAARAGLTLVELLVVVGIILLLAAVAIPAFRPLAEGGTVREAARALSAYIQGARIRAIESGRPVGVLLERFANNPNACFVVHQVEFPPLYSGEYAGATVRVAVNWAAQPPLNPPEPVLVLAVAVGAISDGVIRPGDAVQLNFRGAWYQIAEIGYNGNPMLNPDSNNDGFIDFTAPDGNGDGFHDGQLLVLRMGSAGNYQPLPWPAGQFSPPVPFRIQRLPNLDPQSTGFGGALLAGLTEPLQLRGGAVVDLKASGTETFPDAFEALGSGDLMPTLLVFAPDGRLDRIGHVHREEVGNKLVAADFEIHPALEPVYLLVGSWQRMPEGPRDLQIGQELPDLAPSQADDGIYNWQDAKNVWVVISPRTGAVFQADVYAPDAQPLLQRDAATISASIATSRRLAHELQLSKGGR